MSNGVRENTVHADTDLLVLAEAAPAQQLEPLCALTELIETHEDWLMKRILEYAKQRDYTRYTSTLEEAWRLSISGLSASLIHGFQHYNRIPEFGPDENFTDDPMTHFGILEAQRHRQRGVSLGMFLGLMKYYRQSYHDLVQEECSNPEYLELYRQAIQRGFDRIEIAFCQEWAGTSNDGRLDELQKANRLITNEKNAYLTAFESLTDPVIITDAQERIAALNHAAARLVHPSHVPGQDYYAEQTTDHSPPEPNTAHSLAGQSLLNKPIGEVFPWIADLLPSLQDDLPVICTTLIGTHTQWFEIRRSAMLDVSDKFSGSILTLRNITHQKQAEQTITEEREQLLAIFECINEPVYIGDTSNHEIIYTNNAFRRIWGDVTGKPCHLAIQGADSPCPYCAPVLSSDETPQPHPIWEFHDAQTDRWFRCINRMIRWPDGRKARYHMAIDITDHKRAAAELTRINQQLRQEIASHKLTEEALRIHMEAVQTANDAARKANATLATTIEELAHKNEELDQFTYVASHDLQAPLRSLTAFSSLLAKDLGDNLSERASKDLRFITEAASRMQALVQDLLSLSRTGRAEIKRERISLHDCIHHALNALAATIEDVDAEIAMDELPEVVGDSTMLTQVYQNLIGNSLKFVPRGQKPVIRLTAEKADGKWIFGVRDNGIGIDPKYTAQIFAPFRRLHGHNEYEGSGIGLAICNKTIMRHGGRLWVESEPGNGSHFRFTLSESEEAVE